MARKNRGKAKTKTPPSSASVPPPPPVKPKPTATTHVRHALGRLSVAELPPAASAPSTPLVEPKATATVDDLGEEDLHDILRRLSAADLLRAALACHRWRRVASRCCTRAPPLLGYFFHPTRESDRTYSNAVFAPLDGSVQPLSLDFAPEASDFLLYDSHQGLLLLEPGVKLPKAIVPRFLVLDPATRRSVLLPPPPRDTVLDDRIWRSSRYYVGSAILSRAHPSKLCFEAICFAIDDGHPRAWVASVDNGECRWRALPRDLDVVVEFDPFWFEGRCVHAAGKIYWHICNSWRLLVLDPSTLKFSYLPVPAVLRTAKYRVGETPEDGRLCLVTDADSELQLWVRGEAKWSDRGWLLERKLVDLRVLCDMIPGLPTHPMFRVLSVYPSDMDAGRTGKVFIRTTGYGRFSFHLDTGKLERLSTESGMDYGHPIFAYSLAWPPEFLAREY